MGVYAHDLSLHNDFSILQISLVDLEINKLTKILFLATVVFSVAMLALKVLTTSGVCVLASSLYMYM